jgi:hypothetical protein
MVGLWLFHGDASKQQKTEICTVEMSAQDLRMIFHGLVNFFVLVAGQMID